MYTKKSDKNKDEAVKKIRHLMSEYEIANKLSLENLQQIINILEGKPLHQQSYQD